MNDALKAFYIVGIAEKVFRRFETNGSRLTEEQKQEIKVYIHDRTDVVQPIMGSRISVIGPDTENVYEEFSKRFDML